MSDKPLRREGSSLRQKDSVEIDFAAMTLDDRAHRRRNSTSSNSGESDSQVAQDPERKRYKDQTQREVEEYFKRYQECMQSFMRHYEEYGNLKYVFDEDHEYNRDVKKRKKIENIFYIHRRAKDVKFDYMSIKGNLQDFDKIPINNSDDVKKIIESHMTAYKRDIDWLEDLEAYLVLHRLDGGSSFDESEGSSLSSRATLSG